MNVLFRIIDKITEVIGVITFCAMCVIIFFQVIARYLFANAQPWPEEVARFCFIICTFACINYCMEKDGHLRLMIIPECLKGKADRVFAFFYLFFMVCYCALSLQMGYELTTKIYKLHMKAVTVPVQLYWIWTCILVFTFFTLLVSLRRFCQLLVGAYPVKEDS